MQDRPSRPDQAERAMSGVPSTFEKTQDPAVAATEILAHFLRHLRDSLKSLPARDDRAGIKNVQKNTAILLGILLPEWLGLMKDALTAESDGSGSDAPAAAKAPARPINHERFSRVRGAKTLILSWLPRSFSERLVQSWMIVWLYRKLAYRLTRHPAFLNTPVGNARNIRTFMRCEDRHLTRIAERYFKSHSHEMDALLSFRDVLSAKNIDIVLLSHVFPTTWAGIVDSLRESGIKLAWIGSIDEKNLSGYGVVTTSEVGLDLHITPFPFVLALLALARQTNALVNTEAYFHANWDAEKAGVQYMFMSALFAAAKHSRGESAKKVCAIAYDAIKPIIYAKGNGNIAAHYYKTMVETADLLVYNSNAPDYHDFLVGALGHAVPAAYLYRIQSISATEVERKLTRRPYVPHKEFHIACISVSLGEFPEPSRDAVPAFLKRLIAAPGVRFHYYCDTESPAIAQFKRETSADVLANIEFHGVIRDQKALINELGQYHLGFTPFDHNAFARGIARVENRFYKDALSAFWQSTIATSFLVYSAAGLPVLVPRGCHGILQFVPEACILRASLSEIPLLAQRVYAMDYASILQAAERNRATFTRSHVGGFVELIRSGGEASLYSGSSPADAVIDGRG